MIDILIFVEDDGAANLVRGLAPLWKQHDLSVVTAAAGPAATRLAYLTEDHVVIQPGASAEHLLHHYQPRLVAVGSAENLDTLALPLVRAARACGVPTVGLVDAHVNAAWRWRGRTKDSLAYVPDWLVVGDEETKQAYEALHVPKDHIEVVGHVQVDYIADVQSELDRRGRAGVRAEVLPPEAQARPVVIFVAEQFTRMGLARSDHKRIVAALEAVLAAGAALTPAPFVVARLHPKNRRTDVLRYKHKIDYVSHGGDGLPVVYSGDMIIGCTSTLLFEAALLGRPTLAVLSRADEHECLPSIVAGITRVATTRAGVRESMSDVFRGTWQTPAWPDMWQPGARNRLADVLHHLASL